MSHRYRLTPTPQQEIVRGGRQTSTRLPGHGLLSEGRPYEWRQGDEEDAPSWHRTDWRVTEGCGVCSCGAFSGPLLTNGARRRWYGAHKGKVRSEGER